MSKYTQFLLRIDPKMLKHIDIISENGKVSEQMRKMLGEWININYPDEDIINNRILELESEISKLNYFKNNINLININKQEELKTTNQYRDDMIDAVMNMISIHFIHNTSDSEYHKKWMTTLKFDNKDEMLDYLNKKWNEYGITGVLSHTHRSEFIKSRTDGLELKARLERLTFEDFISKHNINLYKEYDAGNLKGSSKDFEEYKNRIFNKSPQT